MSSPSHFQFSAVINAPTRYAAVNMRHKLAMEPSLLVAAAVFLYLLYGVYLQLDQGLTYSSHELFSTSDRSDTNTTNLRIWWLISRNSWQNKAAFKQHEGTAEWS